MDDVKTNDSKISGCSLITRGSNDIIFSCRFPSAGAYKLCIYAKHRGEREQYRSVIDYIINADSGKGPHYGYPVTTASYAGRKIIINCPLDRYLKIGSTVQFNLIIPNAASSMLIEGENTNMLKKDGDDFSGDININNNSIILIADYSTNSVPDIRKIARIFRVLIEIIILLDFNSP